jgi:hypothetical protein
MKKEFEFLFLQFTLNIEKERHNKKVKKFSHFILNMCFVTFDSKTGKKS